MFNTEQLSVMCLIGLMLALYLCYLVVRYLMEYWYVVVTTVVCVIMLCRWYLRRRAFNVHDDDDDDTDPVSRE